MSASQVKVVPFQTGIWRVALKTMWAIGALLCFWLALFSYRYLLRIGDEPRLITNNLFRNPWLLPHTNTNGRGSKHHGSVSIRAHSWLTKLREPSQSEFYHRQPTL